MLIPVACEYFCRSWVWDHCSQQPDKESAKERASADLRRCDEALKRDPGRVSAWHDQGVSLAELERYDEAVESFDRALAIDSEYAEAWICRGDVLYSQQRYEDALAACLRACALEPENVCFMNGAGKTLTALHRYEESSTVPLRLLRTVCICGTIRGKLWPG